MIHPPVRIVIQMERKRAHEFILVCNLGLSKIQMQSCLLLVKVVGLGCAHERVKSIISFCMRNRRESGREPKIQERFLIFPYPFMKRKRRNTERRRKMEKRNIRTKATNMRIRRLGNIINIKIKKRSTRRKRKNMSFPVFVNR